MRSLTTSLIAVWRLYVDSYKFSNLRPPVGVVVDPILTQPLDVDSQIVVRGAEPIAVAALRLPQIEFRRRRSCCVVTRCCIGRRRRLSTVGRQSFLIGTTRSGRFTFGRVQIVETWALCQREI